MSTYTYIQVYIHINTHARFKTQHRRNDSSQGSSRRPIHRARMPIARLAFIQQCRQGAAGLFLRLNHRVQRRQITHIKRLTFRRDIETSVAVVARLLCRMPFEAVCTQIFRGEHHIFKTGCGGGRCFRALLPATRVYDLGYGLATAEFDHVFADP